MKMEFIDWLKDQEGFLNDAIKNGQPGFTHFDIRLLEAVTVSLRLYNQWLESGGTATWRNNKSGTSDQTPNAFKRSEGVAGIRSSMRRSRMRRTTDSHNSSSDSSRY